MVGRLATVDGSTITCHTCDGGYRVWMDIKPAADYPAGAMNTINKGIMHTKFASDTRNVRVAGEIPQVRHTYSFLNVAYPCMNEHQLGIGETTFGGRRELRSQKGIFQIEELERIALERTTNCRDAIKLIGELVAEYGYCDGGECLTLIDPKEVWHMEIMGAGPETCGGVWAAVRIPDDHVGISANICRVATLDLENQDFFMASENIHSLAAEKGWWDPDSGEPFKFWKAYSGGKPFSIREYWVLSQLAPSLKLKYDAEELPFTVKPDEKVSLEQVMEMYRTTYAGSEYDYMKNLTVNGEVTPVLNAWMLNSNRDLKNLLNALNPDAVGSRFRPIAVEYCAYSTVIQARDWLPDAIGGVTWLGFDNPALSPRIPIFSGCTELPRTFHVGDKNEFRRDSAAWAFRRVAKLSNMNWAVSSKMIEETLQKYEAKAFAELPSIEKKALELYQEDPEKAREFLTQYSNDFARTLVQKYWELGDRILEK
ncbi:MAG: peptidase [Planctomycetes bacterium]|nr:peptidase [Planctomycetota bacterium]